MMDSELNVKSWTEYEHTIRKWSELSFLITTSSCYILVDKWVRIVRKRSITLKEHLLNMTCCTFHYTLFNLFLIIFWESRECGYKWGSKGDLMAMDNAYAQLLYSHGWTTSQVSWIFNGYDVNTKIIRILKKLPTWNII